ncbi:MAG: amidase [Proteobacteria bacterium]|nr:amidase [Pseudomonadota bacterium]MBU2261949.1 amidase [Pseudomonadota bacterium]
MIPVDLCYLGLIDVGLQIQRRQLSSVEVTRTLLERISQLDGRLRSYATVTPEMALHAAEEADREINRGVHRGPLHGVPIAVKDLCHTKGIATAAGMAIYRNFVPERDATVVSRLKAAGAVLLGKLQMTEGAFSVHHPSIKPPINPWSAAHWTGVSSSGSGVATAVGLCYGSLGTDTLGSIRFPSTMNGITGLKPTWGRVSRAGVFALAESMDHIGPMTRSAADTAAMLGAIAGADSDDPTAVQDQVPDYLAGIDGGVRGIRIGIDRPLIAAGADDDMARVTEGACTVFAQLGAELRDVVFPSPDQIVRDAVLLCAAEAAVAHEATFPTRANEYGPVLSGLLETGCKVDGLTFAKILLRRAAFKGRLAALFREIDLLLMPAMNSAAPTLALLAERMNDPEARFARVRFTAPFNMSGSPSLTLPGGATDEGLPVGFQIIGRHLDEALVLRAGHAFQQATQWHMRRPVASISPAVDRYSGIGPKSQLPWQRDRAPCKGNFTNIVDKTREIL